MAARVSVHLPAQDGSLTPCPAAGDAFKSHGPAWFDSAFLSTPIYDRARLGPGARFVRHNRLVPNSGGDGTHRGGLGQETLVELRRDASVFFMTERTSIPASGLGGGTPGGLGAVEIYEVPADARRSHHLRAGLQVLVRTPGGGGYGPATARDPAARARDAAEGYTEP